MTARNTVAGTSERKSPQDALGRYYTPDPVALALLWRWRGIIGVGFRVVDPFAGGGAWLRAGRAIGPEVAGCDLDPDAPAVLSGEAIHGDGLDYMRGLRDGEVIATNPPFGIMDQAVMAALTAWHEGRVSSVVILGRLTQAEGTSRAAVYRRWPPTEIVVPARRMRWGGPGGDALAGGTDNFGALAMIWRWPTLAGDTRAVLGWAPEDEQAPGGGGQIGLFGGAR